MFDSVQTRSGSARILFAQEQACPKGRGHVSSLATALAARILKRTYRMNLCARPQSSRSQRPHSDGRVPLHDFARMLDPQLASVASDLAFVRRRVRTSQFLYRSGDPFGAIYFVLFGSFKSIAQNQAGVEQVLAFPMKGDFLGVDGIANGAYTCEMRALELAEVLVLPFAQFAALCRFYPGLETIVFRLLGGELSRLQELLIAMGTLTAEARVARFLLDLGARHKALGYSGQSFVLKMTREDIGNHLGLTLETVSRCLSTLKASALVAVELREIRIFDHAALTEISRGNAKSLYRIEASMNRTVKAQGAARVTLDS